jgi:hypothetical protein
MLSNTRIDFTYTFSCNLKYPIDNFTNGSDF